MKYDIFNPEITNNPWRWWNSLVLTEPKEDSLIDFKPSYEQTEHETLKLKNLPEQFKADRSYVFRYTPGKTSYTKTI